MNATEILTEIKGALGLESSEQTLTDEVAIDLAVEKLENGTSVKADDDFVAGASAFIIHEDGEIPLPPGNYEMSNGDTLICEVEGVISEYIKASDSKEEAPAEEEVEAAAEDEAPEEEKIEAEYVTKEEFSAAMDEIKAMIEEKYSQDLAKEIPVEAEKVEASSQEIELAAEPIAHNPESTSGKFNLGYQNKTLSTTSERIKSILNNI
tara:strand:+ start:10403 stop:11026 length:624 start_codon:yes stop_codon:yes gene_type:complete